MPPHKCSYFKCVNTSDMKSMFRFPRNDANRLKVWLNNCGNSTIAHLPPESLQSRYLCIDHFNKKYVCNQTGHRKRLQRVAIPEPYQAPEALHHSCTDPHQSQDVQDEPLTEKKNNIFCPKCNSEVEHTAAGIQEDQTKTVISKVYHYFELEYEELKEIYKDLDLTPLSRFTKRTALATGVSETTVLQILKEEKQRNADNREELPQKRRRATTSPREMDREQAVPAIVPVEVKAEPRDDEVHGAQFQSNFETVEVKIEPLDVDYDKTQIELVVEQHAVKVEPCDDEENNWNKTLVVSDSGGITLTGRSKRKPKDVTLTQQHTRGESSTPKYTRSVPGNEGFDKSSVSEEMKIKMEIDIHEEGFS